MGTPRPAPAVTAKQRKTVEPALVTGDPLVSVHPVGDPIADSARAILDDFRATGFEVARAHEGWE